MPIQALIRGRRSEQPGPAVGPTAIRPGAPGLLIAQYIEKLFCITEELVSAKHDEITYD
jgi:hypothetical protein